MEEEKIALEPSPSDITIKIRDEDLWERAGQTYDRIAALLGVEPSEEIGCGIVIVGSGDRRYDFLELVEALLAKIEGEL